MFSEIVLTSNCGFLILFLLRNPKMPKPIPPKFSIKVRFYADLENLQFLPMFVTLVYHFHSERSILISYFGRYQQLLQTRCLGVPRLYLTAL